MATIGIWKITKRLDHVVSYTTDEEKTAVEDYTDLHKAIDYIAADFKTEKQMYVSAINCGVSTVLEEMKITKQQWNKKDGILGYHCFQSFKGKEVSPDMAHEIGIKLANEIWGERFEVIVSTHLNTNNIHNHFVINSVSFKDGKKYLDNRMTYALLRETNDTICEEYGLQVLKEKVCRRSGINYGAYYQKQVQHESYYSETKANIDLAIKQANTYTDFENILKAMKYKLIYRAEKLSVRKDPYKKNIRIHRSFGEEYTKERIEERIQTEFVEIKPYIEITASYKYFSKHSNYKKEKAKGIYGLYLHYCYLLKVFPNKYPKKVLSAEIRADIKQLEAISLQTRYLVENKIISEHDLLDSFNNSKQQLNELLGTRENLWKRYNRLKVNDGTQKNLKLQINETSKQISEVRKDVRMCKSIMERVNSIAVNLEQQYESQKRKER